MDPYGYVWQLLRSSLDSALLTDGSAFDRVASAVAAGLVRLTVGRPLPPDVAPAIRALQANVERVVALGRGDASSEGAARDVLRALFALHDEVCQKRGAMQAVIDHGKPRSTGATT